MSKLDIEIIDLFKAALAVFEGDIPSASTTKHFDKFVIEAYGGNTFHIKSKRDVNNMEGQSGIFLKIEDNIHTAEIILDDVRKGINSDFFKTLGEALANAEAKYTNEETNLACARLAIFNFIDTCM